jgi:hypothetical protein
MTETVNKGLLTDKEGTGFPGCRITVDGVDTPFTVLQFVQKYLDAIPKSTPVCFQTKDGKISKIWQDKDQPASGTSSETRTSPEKPVTEGLKTVEGQIVNIDHPAHKVTVKDRAGTLHSFVWGPTFNDQMAKLQQWWFTKITGEQEKDFPDLWRLTAQGFFKKPDDWPQSQHHGKGGSYQPRNERAIIMQVVFKEACETARQFSKLSDTFDEDAANAAWEWAVAKTEATMDRLCKAGGV